jgi:curved DNA-binding protein
MEFKDYYQTLGVSRDATADDIKKAFRKMARKYHPDVSKEPDAEARMKEINEANTVLSDPEKRAAYDQLGRGYRPGQEFRPPPDWDAGFEFSGRGFSPSEAADFSDFFAELFGRMGGGHGGGGFHAHGGNFRARGEDHYAKVVLDLEDAFTGATRQISLRVPKQDAQGRLQLATRTLNVKIPKGVREGQVIRLAGQGAPGTGGGAAAGDLLLEVHFKPHDRLRAVGRDLHLTLPVAPWEAALGAIVAVDLPDASLKVRIPQGAQSGRQLRVRGKGIPGSPPGDLLLDIQIVLPTADTPKARELYETMARELAFDPRSLDPRRHGRT